MTQPSYAGDAVSLGTSKTHSRNPQLFCVKLRLSLTSYLLMRLSSTSNAPPLMFAVPAPEIMFRMILLFAVWLSLPIQMPSGPQLPVNGTITRLQSWMLLYCMREYWPLVLIAATQS